MTEALKLAIDFGQNNAELERIIAITTKKNIPAIKLLGRLNFIKIADLKDDSAEYAIVKP